MRAQTWPLTGKKRADYIFLPPCGQFQLISFTFKKFLPLNLLAALLVSCGSGTPEHEALPMLASPSRQAAWGAPKVTQTDRGYELLYENPLNQAESLKIKGSRTFLYGLNFPPDIRGQKVVDGKKISTKTAQVWQKTEIAGKEVYLYQTHYPINSEGARHKTHCAELMNSRGVIGYYSVDIEGSKSQVNRWLKELRFVR